MTDIQTYVDMCKRHPETIAVELEKLAAHVRRLGEQFDGTTNASNVAADIVNDTVQRMGNIGSRLWQVVSDAGHLDRVIAVQKSAN